MRFLGRKHMICWRTDQNLREDKNLSVYLDDCWYSSATTDFRVHFHDVNFSRECRLDQGSIQFRFHRLRSPSGCRSQEPPLNSLFNGRLPVPSVREVTFQWPPAFGPGNVSERLMEFRLASSNSLSRFVRSLSVLRGLLPVEVVAVHFR